MAETRVPRGINFAGREGWDELFSSNTTLNSDRYGSTPHDSEHCTSGSSDDIGSEISVVMPSSFLYLITVMLRKIFGHRDWH